MGPMPKATMVEVLLDAEKKVLSALDNDLNTPQALAVIAELAKTANDVAMDIKKKGPISKHLDLRPVATFAAYALLKATAPLGLMQAKPDEYLRRTQERRLRIRALDPSEIDAKLAERAAARASKDFAKADAIRKDLLEKGIEVFDSATGSAWRVNP
jgi:cysteinyl-tRNA synthetase